MGQSPEELNAQIETTRGNLSADIDALQDRVSPSAIVGRQKAAAKDRVLGVKSRIMGSDDSDSSLGDSAKDRAKDVAGTAEDRFAGSPLAAGVVAFGLGLVVAALAPASKAEERVAHQLKDAAQEHGGPAIDQVTSAASDIGAQLKESAQAKAQDLKESAQESAGTVKQEGQSSASTVAEDASARHGS